MPRAEKEHPKLSFPLDATRAQLLSLGHHHRGQQVHCGASPLHSQFRQSWHNHRCLPSQAGKQLGIVRNSTPLFKRCCELSPIAHQNRTKPAAHPQTSPATWPGAMTPIGVASPSLPPDGKYYSGIAYTTSNFTTQKQLQIPITH